MMLKTHIVLGMFVALFFLPYVRNSALFIPLVLIATLLPDIDTARSFLGHRKVFRPIQWIVRHRSLFHSFTLCIPITLLFALYLPSIALPFFLGYSMHLFADSLTIEGIRPFWPSKAEIVGRIRTGGHIEKVIFAVFVVLDILLLIRLII